MRLIIGGLCAACFCGHVLVASTTVFATGMTKPESIVQLSTGAFLVSGSSSGLVWIVASTGGPAAQFDNLASASLGEVLLPASFGANAGDLFVAFDTLAGSGDIVNTTTAAVTGTVTGPASASWATAIAVPAGFGTIAGDVLIASENSQLDLLTPGSNTASVFATAPIEAFGTVFAPAGFGSVAGQLLISNVAGNTIYSVAANGASTLFATLPAGSTLRQMAFAPSGFGTFGGDLFVSDAGANGDGVGEILVVNSAGQLVSALTAAQLGIGNDAAFSPRGLTFLNSQTLLIDDNGGSEIFEVSTAIVTPEPAPLLAIGIATLALFTLRSRRAIVLLRVRLTLAVLTVGCGLGVGQVQTGVGAKYGSRDPMVCSSTKAPASGVPSASQLKDYVRCDAYLGEKTDGKSIYLLENLQVEIAKGRLYQDSEKGVSNIDPSQPVYPIRGSYDKYQCSVLVAGGLPNATRGANCFVVKHPHATGICYKSTFGDWGCMMVDSQANVREGQFNMPPLK